MPVPQVVTREVIPTLFSASQPSAGVFFTQQHFDWSLHYNLLFHPAGLVSPDPFFFCPLLYSYLEQSPDRRTWYEQALVEGLIIPFVRDSSVGGYHELWEKMFRSALQGHYDKGEIVAKRLDKLKGRATPEFWKPWPSEMGRRFSALVTERCMSQRSGAMPPPNLRDKDWNEIDALLRRTQPIGAFLERIQPFLFEDIDAASHSLAPEEGLRVSEVLWASGRRILGENTRIRNVEDLLEKMRLSGKTSQEITDATRFYKILQELYNENMANAFGITKNVTDYDVMSRIFSAEGISDLKRDEEVPRRPLFIDIELPPTDLLRSFSFDSFLIKARDSREFYEYRAAFVQWTLNSAEKTLGQALVGATEAYVSKIHCLCRQRPINWDNYRIAVGQRPSMLRWGGRLVSLAAITASKLLIDNQLLPPEDGVAMAIGGAAAGYVVDHGIEHVVERTEETVDYWLYISKIRRQKATVVARADGSIELHDVTPRPPLSALPRALSSPG